MKWGEFRLRPPGGTFPGFDRTLAGEPAVTRKAILHYDWTEDGWLSVVYRLRADEPAPVMAALEADETVVEFELVGTDGDDLIVFVDAAASPLMERLLDVVGSNSLLLDGPIRCVDDGYRMALAGTSEAVQAGYEAVCDHVDVAIDRIETYEPARPKPLRELTDRQRAALETAYELGYYESPRKVSYEELAAELDCAQTTANDLLRRAEAHLVETALDA